MSGEGEETDKRRLDRSRIHLMLHMNGDTEGDSSGYEQHYRCDVSDS